MTYQPGANPTPKSPSGDPRFFSQHRVARSPGPIFRSLGQRTPKPPASTQRIAMDTYYASLLTYFRIMLRFRHRLVVCRLLVLQGVLTLNFRGKAKTLGRRARGRRWQPGKGAGWQTVPLALAKHRRWKRKVLEKSSIRKVGRKEVQAGRPQHWKEPRIPLGSGLEEVRFGSLAKPRFRKWCRQAARAGSPKIQERGKIPQNDSETA